MGRENKKKQLIFVVILALCIIACGKGVQAAEPEQTLPDNVIAAYVSENIEYVDEIIPAQYTDDLTLLADMRYTNGTYVYHDGKVYCRRYHADSYEAAALSGAYHAIPETKKEMVCVDADGTETVLFTDEGYGDIYLVNNRFYLTDGGIYEDSRKTYTGKRLYSVDMQGNDRIEYGNGSIYAIDAERKIFILKVKEDTAIDDTTYYVMNYETGERKLLFDGPVDDFHFYIGGYQDGWLYYHNWEGDFGRLCAVSIEGEEREIIAVTSEHNLENESSYRERIIGVEVDRDRVYFIFGGYDGSANVFQGGTLISVKLDGTDYKAVHVEDNDFYISHDKGKTLVYFPRYDFNYFFRNGISEENDMLVWDVEAEICYCSDFPTNILYNYYIETDSMCRYYPADKGTLYGVTDDEMQREETDVYAIPGDSGKIVRVVMDIEKYVAKWQGEGIDKVEYNDFYFADGVLYFKAEYSAYDKETSIGWRDGYRRLHTDIYRLKIGEDKAEVLYSY